MPEITIRTIATRLMGWNISGGWVHSSVVVRFTLATLGCPEIGMMEEALPETKELKAFENHFAKTKC